MGHRVSPEDSKCNHNTHLQVGQVPGTNVGSHMLARWSGQEAAWAVLRANVKTERV